MEDRNVGHKGEKIYCAGRKDGEGALGQGRRWPPGPEEAGGECRRGSRPC